MKVIYVLNKSGEPLMPTTNCGYVRILLKTKKAVSAKNFNMMFKHIHKVVEKTAQDIYGGKYPIRCSDDACTWCDYGQLCRFDTSFAGCMTQPALSLKDDEIWELLEKEAAENGIDA